MLFKNRDKGTWDGIEKAAVMGTNFVAHTIVGLVLGYYTDKWFGTSPWGLLGWLILGVVAGFRTMYVDAMKMSRTQSLKGGSAKAPGDGAPKDGGPGGARDA